MMAAHEQSVGATVEWYTPPRVFEALGCRFDVDVASPGAEVTPWIPANSFITKDSLEMEWGENFIWMNPPFNDKANGIFRNGIVPWLQKFFAYGNGIALVPDRTSAPWWQQYAPQATLILFVSGKLRFIGQDGKPGRSPAQGACLLGSGERCRDALFRARARGLGIITEPHPR